MAVKADSRYMKGRIPGVSAPSNNTTKTSNTGPISYNGSYVTYDNNIDYQAKINDAVRSGDYASASQYEAQRNAKLDGLGRGSEATTNYTQVYNGGTPNNLGGTVYESKYNNVGSAPSDWTSLATNTGQTYQNNNGSYMLQTGGNSSGPTYTNVGTGYNGSEFTWNDRGLAENYANQQQAGYGGGGNIDNAYIDALMRGERSKYFNDTASNVQSQKKEMAKQAASVETYGDYTNSFESENELQPETAPSKKDEYVRRMTQLTSGRKNYIY